MADQGPEFIIGVLFMSVTAFIVWLGYKFLVPIWHMTVAPLAAQYPAMVNNDPTYVSAFGTIASELNIVLQYSFFVIMIGVGAAFITVFAYRRQNTSSSSGEDEF